MRRESERVVLLKCALSRRPFGTAVAAETDVSSTRSEILLLRDLCETNLSIDCQMHLVSATERTSGIRKFMTIYLISEADRISRHWNGSTPDMEMSL